MKSFYPEMGEARPKADGRVSLSHYGKHYFVYTRLELHGRGIEFLSTATAEDLTEAGQHRVGEHQYKVTMLAFDKLKEQYDFSNEILLD